MSTHVFAPAFLLSLFVIAAASAAPLERRPNTTLRLPDELPTGSFRTENAFPGLSFRRPLALVTPPGETERIFVVEQPGTIQVIADLAEPSKEVFLDLSADVTFQGEAGLLGLAFHPRYAENGYFYVFYSRRSGGVLYQRLARFEVDARNPNRALRQSEVPMLDQRDQADNHNGGDLHFGPDGYLYISLGDEGGANDQYGNSRSIDEDFFAAIARIDVDQRPGSLPPNPHPAVHPDTYAIPPDNPFIGTETFLGRPVDRDKVRTEFWAVGLRNPWRMAFDRQTGRLFCGDVGQGSREEINVIESGGHYGWNYREGTRRFTSAPGTADPPASLDPLEPIWDYGHNEGNSVTGGVVYRGEEHTELYGAYVFGDFGSGAIWALHFNDDGSVTRKAVADEGSDEISAFGVDPRNGEILLTAHRSGEVRRVARRSSGFVLLIPSTLSRTGAFAELETLTPHEGIVSYEPNVPFWSDGALKKRWFSIPDMDDVMSYSEAEPWTFPEGTTWIKHFELELEPGNPASRRRVETRFLVKTQTANYGLTYAWNEEQTEANVVPPEGAETSFTMQTPEGPRTQNWLFPSRNACRACHTNAAGHALSFRTAQLNRIHDYEGTSANQITALAEAGYFAEDPAGSPSTWPSLPSLDDTGVSVQERARAYLDVNCSQCHRPDGTALGTWDARAHVPLEATGLVEGRLVKNFGDSELRVLAPGEPDHSMILLRMNRTAGYPPMPPFGTNETDETGIGLIRSWVMELETGSGPSDFAAWMAAYLTEESGREDDPDHDGLTNEGEFVAGTHPLRGDSFWKALIRRGPDRSQLVSPGTERGRIRFQRSEDARTWEDWSPPSEDVQPGAGGGQVVHLQPGERQAFFRFRLEENGGEQP